jgi:hypothetical protein
MKAFLGDYVKTNFHNHIGRVYAKYHSFNDVNESESWFNLQSPRLDENTKSENWYSILCHPAGAVVVPESQLIIVSPTPIEGEYKNPWNDHYFRANKITARTILYGAEAQTFFGTAIGELGLRNEKKILTDNTTCLKVATGGYWKDKMSNLFFAFDNWSHDLTVEEFDSEEEASKYAYGILATTKDKVEI